MRYAVIVGDTVSNIIEIAEGDPTSIEGLSLVPDPQGKALIGERFVNGTFKAPARKKVHDLKETVSSMSRAQFLLGLLREGYASPDELMSDPEPPEFLMDAFSQLPDDKRVIAIVTYRARSSFDARDPIFAFYMPAYAPTIGKSFGTAELADFFDTYGTV